MHTLKTSLRKSSSSTPSFTDPTGCHSPVRENAPSVTRTSTANSGAPRGSCSAGSEAEEREGGTSST